MRRLAASLHTHHTGHATHSWPRSIPACGPIRLATALTRLHSCKRVLKVSTHWQSTLRPLADSYRQDKPFVRWPEWPVACGSPVAGWSALTMGPAAAAALARAARGRLAPGFSSGVFSAVSGCTPLMSSQCGRTPTSRGARGKGRSIICGGQTHAEVTHLVLRAPPWDSLPQPAHCRRAPLLSAYSKAARCRRCLATSWERWPVWVRECAHLRDGHFWVLQTVDV